MDPLNEEPLTEPATPGEPQPLPETQIPSEDRPVPERERPSEDRPVPDREPLSTPPFEGEGDDQEVAEDVEVVEEEAVTDTPEGDAA